MADTNPFQRRMQTLDQATGNAFNSKKPGASEEESRVRSYEFKRQAGEPEDPPDGGGQVQSGPSKLDALNAAKAKAKTQSPVKKEPEVYSATE